MKAQYPFPSRFEHNSLRATSHLLPKHSPLFHSPRQHHKSLGFCFSLWKMVTSHSLSLSTHTLLFHTRHHLHPTRNRSSRYSFPSNALPSNSPCLLFHFNFETNILVILLFSFLKFEWNWINLIWLCSNLSSNLSYWCFVLFCFFIFFNSACNFNQFNGCVFIYWICVIIVYNSCVLRRYRCSQSTAKKTKKNRRS